MLFELACLAVPAVFVIAAENQVKSANYHRQQGWCVVLDQEASAKSIVSAALALWSDPVKRQAMSEIAQRQVDGKGASRVAAFLQKKFLANPMQQVVSE